MKKSLLLFTAILTVFLFALPVYAADIRLSSSCSLADAIIAANNDRAEGDCPAGRGTDTITLTKDITLQAELPAITSEITIEGNGYTINGNNRYRIFYNDGGALAIKDLTMTKGYVEADLIRNEDGTLKASTANSIGGAIYNAYGTVSISLSSFSDNSTENGGGAVYNEGELSISDSNFSGNSAEDDGGAITNGWGRVSISDSSFSGNSAEDDGGAIYNASGTLSISDSSFSGNSADDNGGAIYNDGELSISDSNFNGNSADFWGGAIVNNGELSISSNTFSHNSTEYNGGAIFNRYGRTLSISGSSFSGNLADSLGGAISNRGELSISNSTFSHNSAEDEGGAIRNSGELSFVNSTFSHNSADKGGAIFNGGELSMVNSVIASNGGACYSSNRLRHNISNFIQDGSCSPALRGDPMLGELVVPDDGSPAYSPLLAGSPAIDAAYDDLCPETDQIGTERPQGTGCDIGAIEYTAP